MSNYKHTKKDILTICNSPSQWLYKLLGKTVVDREIKRLGIVYNKNTGKFE